MNTLSTHSGDDVDTWLASHPNMTLHYTPTGSSWVTVVEAWLGIITRQAIRRGTFTSLRHLILKIKDDVTYWNADAKAFEWAATPQNHCQSRDTPRLPQATRQQTRSKRS